MADRLPVGDVALGKIAAPTGSYVSRDRVVPSSAESYDPARERELWVAADRLAGVPSGLEPHAV